MSRAGVDEICETKLPDVPESLKDFRVDELESQLIDTDVIPERIAQCLESHARP